MLYLQVTSVYFAVRNYWRGFFAAIIGALCFAMLCVWFDEPDTIVPHFPTGFSMEFPYDPQVTTLQNTLKTLL